MGWVLSAVGCAAGPVDGTGPGLREPEWSSGPITPTTPPHPTPVGRADPDGLPEPGPVPPAETTCGLTPAPDLDPDPAVMEVEVRASPFAWDPGDGVPVADGLAFEGQVPGPTIVVDQGQTLRVRFVNDTDTAHNLHWHGMRVPSDQDDISAMADPVPPGGYFTYEFQAIDAGFYWYHPNVDTALLLERGLVGTVWVRDPAEPAADCLSVVVLGDLLRGEDGAVLGAPLGPDPWAEMERLGDTLLANGRTDTHTRVAAGSSVLLALLNVANARYFDLAIDGHDLEVVGTDGGWISTPHPVESLRITPGERWMVHFVAGAPGSYPVRTRTVPIEPAPAPPDPIGAGPHTVFTLDVAGPAVPTTPLVLPPPGEPFPPADAPLQHVIYLDEDAVLTHQGGGGWLDLATTTVPFDEPGRYDVVNVSHMRHPFHVHGQRLAMVNGTELERLGWKDTFDVPHGTTRTFVTMDDNPGSWLYHCHHAVHVERGMVGVISIPAP